MFTPTNKGWTTKIEAISIPNHHYGFKNQQLHKKKNKKKKLTPIAHVNDGLEAFIAVATSLQSQTMGESKP